jgi:HEAT repeat protein
MSAHFPFLSSSKRHPDQLQGRLGAWTNRGQIRLPSLIEVLKSGNSDVRVIAIQSLEHLRATEASPVLRLLLEDNERSHFGALVTVAETAKAAIASLEKK